MSSLNVNPEFNTEMEQLTPETRAHADRFNERYGQLLGNDAFLKGKLEDANTNIERAMAVAQGKSAGLVFNTYAELLAYISVPANAEKFRLGDQFLIKAMNVPDYWWDNTVTTEQTDAEGNVISAKNTSGKVIGALVELEARKVDLSKYDENDAALFDNMSDQYSASRAYDVGDVCIYDNNLYKCVAAVSTAEAFDQTKWNKTSFAALHADQEKKISENTQSLANINKSKKTYLRLVLPNVTADAKTVCDYINKNYLLGQLSPATTVDFDVVASNADWFTGTLSTDSTTLFSGRTVWGIVQQRSMSADNSTVYKYFAAGEGGAGSVSPFKSYDQGYAQGVTDADNRANANSTNYKTGYNNGYNAGKSDGALTGVSGCCIAGWRSIDAYSNNQWVSGWTGVNPNYFTVNGYGIVPKRNFTATVYWQGYNKRDIDFYSNGVMGHRDNGTSMNGVKMNFYAGTQCGFKTNDRRRIVRSWFYCS